MGRRTSLASLAGGPVHDVPGQNEPTLVRLPLTQAVPTPINPRQDFGAPDELAELGESMRRRQLQPVVVVSRNGYLKLYPEHIDAVGEASHVIANGERRYRAAQQVGMDSLEAVIREEVAASRKAFLDAVLSENIDRRNFDPIEEARGVEAMVAECGSATIAAEQFKRTSAWVSQRRVLLKLLPELQERVSQGFVPVRQAREWGRLPVDRQLAQFEAWRQAKTAPRPAPEPEPTEPSPPTTDSVERAGDRDRQPGPADDPRRDRIAGGVPWHNPQAVNQLARQHMAAEDRATLVKLLAQD